MELVFGSGGRVIAGADLKHSDTKNRFLLDAKKKKRYKYMVPIGLGIQASRRTRSEETREWDLQSTLVGGHF